MPNKSRTHEDARAAVCLLCMRKTTVRKINENLSREISDNVFDYDPFDDRLPNSVCGSCRQKVSSASNGQAVNFQIFDYNKIAIRAQTRSSTLPGVCTCLVCEIAREGPKNIAASSSKGEFNPHCNSSGKTPIKLCRSCLAQIGRGFPHNCSKQDRVSNVNNLLDSVSPNASSKVAAAFIRKQCEEGSSEVQLQSHRGHSLNISIQKKRTISQTSSCARKLSFSTEDMSNIQNHLHLSFNETLNLAKDLRYATHNRKVIEPNLKSNLQGLSHVLDDYFEVSNNPFL